MAASSARTAARGQSNGTSAANRPEKTFRIGSCYATVWCNEVRPEGRNQQPRTFRSVHLERRFWNEKLKNGDGDWDSTDTFGLGDIHNAMAVLQVAAEHLRQEEADVTRD